MGLVLNLLGGGSGVETSMRYIKKWTTYCVRKQKYMRTTPWHLHDQRSEVYCEGEVKIVLRLEHRILFNKIRWRNVVWWVSHFRPLFSLWAPPWTCFLWWRPRWWDLWEHWRGPPEDYSRVSSAHGGQTCAPEGVAPCSQQTVPGGHIAAGYGQ